MSLQDFKVGDEVVFIRDNTDGGKSFGAQGDVRVIHSLCTHNKGKVKVVKAGVEGDWSWYAYKRDLEHNFKAYTPSQEGDCDDDV